MPTNDDHQPTPLHLDPLSVSPPQQAGIQQSQPGRRITAFERACREFEERQEAYQRETERMQGAGRGDNEVWCELMRRVGRV